MDSLYRTTILCTISLLFFLQSYSQDCTIAGYIDKGVANSALIKDLSNQIRSNRVDSLISRAALLPQVDFNGYMMYAPTINGWGYSEVITNGQNLTGTFTVSQDLFNKKTREASLEKLGLQSGSLTTTRKISVNELKKAITAQYLSAYSALEERNFQQDILSTLVEEQSVLKTLTDKGIYRQTDYLSFRIEIMNLERNIHDLDLGYHKELWNLNMICGIADTSSCELKLPAIMDTLVSSPEHSLLFRRFQIDSLLIINDKYLLDRKYKPAVKWFADGGIVNNEPRYLYQNFGVSAGMSMTLPVFDGNQRKLSYDKIRIHEDTRKSYQENFLLQYRSGLQQLQVELSKTRMLMKENEKQVALVNELLAADNSLLDSGQISITDYILAMKNLVEAKHAGLLYQIRAQYVLNEINFRKQ